VTNGWHYLELADFLVIAEELLGIPAEVLARSARIGLAQSALAAPAAEFGGHEFYLGLERKAAVLCSRIARNHALPDGNKRAAFLCLLEFVERHGKRWTESDQDPAETVGMIEGAAAGTVSEDELEQWITSRLTSE
jgi:death on curing protein